MAVDDCRGHIGRRFEMTCGPRHILGQRPSQRTDLGDPEQAITSGMDAAPDTQSVGIAGEDGLGFLAVKLAVDAGGDAAVAACGKVRHCCSFLGGMGVVVRPAHSVRSGHNLVDIPRVQGKDPPAMEDFAENARPTPQGIVGSLVLLRKHDEPFGSDALATRLDLLLLPFLRGIPTVEQRISRLQEALNMVAGLLTSEQQTVYRHIYFNPNRLALGKRRKAAFEELPKEVGFRSRETSRTASGIEERMLPDVAGILLDSEFEKELDDEHPIARESSGSDAIPTHAFQLVSSKISVEIDNEDYRKFTFHRVVRLQALLPDQRIAAIRYHTKTSDPMPVDGSVKLLSEGHTYMGTHPDSHDGAVADWMMHFIHLGGRKEPGDTVTIEMRGELFDEAKSDRHPNVAFTVDHENVESINLAMRLPRAKLAGTAAESRVVRNPHSNSVVDARQPLTIGEDGWARVGFTNPKPGFQYGIFLPDFDLYK
jgi:hypothetical protein